MSHHCILDNSAIVCFEINNQLWVKECSDFGQQEGKTYQVNFCPECGFKLPRPSFAKSFFSAIPAAVPDESITHFIQSLSTAIHQMNHDVELIKAFMISQNTQNECFIERDLSTSIEINYLKRRLLILEEK